MAFLPKIIAFLGYVPYNIGSISLGEKIVTCRNIKGIKQEELAMEFQVSPRTLGYWESNIRKPRKHYLEAIDAFIEPILSGASRSAE